jgi:hypothetical protein
MTSVKPACCNYTFQTAALPSTGVNSANCGLLFVPSERTTSRARADRSYGLHVCEESHFLQYLFCSRRKMLKGTAIMPASISATDRYIRIPTSVSFEPISKIEERGIASKSRSVTASAEVIRVPSLIRAEGGNDSSWLMVRIVSSPTVELVSNGSTCACQRLHLPKAFALPTRASLLFAPVEKRRPFRSRFHRAHSNLQQTCDSRILDCHCV